VIDAPALVPVGADHVQAAQLGNSGPQLDIGASSRHVGGNGDGAQLASSGNHLRLQFFMPSVQDLMGDIM
jgi:hypothetical protein